jgi:hypothetical protein
MTLATQSVNTLTTCLLLRTSQLYTLSEMCALFHTAQMDILSDVKNSSCYVSIIRYNALLYTTLH